jgi:SulP family sulfate permease
MPDISWPATLVAIFTLLVLIVWPRLKTPMPGHLPAVIVGVLVSLLLAHYGQPVETIGMRFSYLLPDGTNGQGIPPFLPHFEWPWLQTGPNGQPFVFSLSMIEALLPAAFAIAMLGAIESLLCAVVLDGMTGKRHSANSELLGQGIGNIITPFFGGITATAAIARSAANVKAGAQSPIAGMIHALVVLSALVWFAQYLSYLPMASMAALLVMVAWNIAEVPKVIHLMKKAPRSDVMVFVLCMTLTVLFDMVIAISAGIVLASLLFMKEIAEMTRASDITEHRKHIPKELPPGWRVFKINGPLFFAAADRIFGELSQMAAQQDGVVLYMDGVPILDNGGLAAMQKFLDKCRKSSTRVWVADLQFQPLKTISRAGVPPIPDWYEYFPTLDEALNRVHGYTKA